MHKPKPSGIIPACCRSLGHTVCRRQIELMSIATDPDSWSFVHASDMHIGSPRSYRYQPAWNANWETARTQILELAPDLLIVGGDMTRDGTTHIEELQETKRMFDALPMPVWSIPGNHEVGNKAGASESIASATVQQFRSVYGPSEWSVVQGEGANAVRFSGFDAFLLGSGLPEEPDLRAWLEAQVAHPREPNHVWVLHPALFADHPDEPDFDPVADRVAWYFALDRAERRYLRDIFDATRATHVITGHVHCRRHLDWDGIQIHYAPSTAFPQWGDRWPDGDDTLGFSQFTVSGGELTPRFVPLRQTSVLRGYGPGGNPPLDGRHYSVAWETPPFR